ncbi:AAA family ATPase [Rhizobium ruizarguesonis]|uniref:AAA family ATPase n=1 Tax=Rhizobium ruizarguesonis TaxID=2081791 RepID=UPI0010318646|nr:AAA family ATPase [Rhizobium ruizarguesonis]TAW21246.1 AAA family ATPase [Rhizobium ruizarguesonis]
MKWPKSDERRDVLEVTTYANSLRVPLRRCGIFLKKGDRAVGLQLPPGADMEKYQRAVRMVLVAAGISHYSVQCITTSGFKKEVNAEDALKALSNSAAVIVLVANEADIPDEVKVAVERIEEVSAVKPYHLILAAKLAMGIVINREQAAELTSYALPLVFSAIRRSRPIEVSLEKLAASSQVKKPIVWEPRIEQLAGYGAAMPWALDLVDDLKEWCNGSIAWSDVDAGLLLSGPPGCGKTLFASALARTCGANFVAASSAQWQSRGHLGDMLGAMRKTFREAINNAPTILFLDEFDSFGSRQNLRGDGAAYGQQVINALLEHLDGASGRDGVVVIAATNRPDDIDEALRRPGRLDRHIQIDLPDLDAREQILSAHVGLPLPPDEIRTIGLATSGYSGAAIQQLARDARRVARKRRRPVCGADFLSIVPPVAEIGEKERWPICVHEAGHAIVGLALGTGEIEAIVVARQAGHRDESFGHVEWRRAVVRKRTLQMYRNEIAMVLAGRAAEQVILSEAYDGSGGAEGSDLHRAADIATVLVGGHGVYGLGYTRISRSRDLDQLRASDPVLRRRVERLLSEELARAEEIIRERRDDVKRIAEALLRSEIVSGSATSRILAGDPPAR